VKPTLEDQKELYLVLGGTAGLLIADRRIENRLPGGDYSFYQNRSNLAIGGLGAAAAGVWIYGIKTDHAHAKELGDLELERLVNTFLIHVRCN
jgi:hypothetical protein